MQLLYLWIENYKNIQQQGFHFSPDFRFDYNHSSQTLTVTEGKPLPKDFFGANISNVTAIVGENGSGKSTLLEFLIYLHNDELGYIPFFLIYKHNNKSFVYEKNLSINIPANWEKSPVDYVQPRFNGEQENPCIYTLFYDAFVPSTFGNLKISRGDNLSNYQFFKKPNQRERPIVLVIPNPETQKDQVIKLTSSFVEIEMSKLGESEYNYHLDTLRGILNNQSLQLPIDFQHYASILKNRNPLKLGGEFENNTWLSSIYTQGKGLLDENKDAMDKNPHQWINNIFPNWQKDSLHLEGVFSEFIAKQPENVANLLRFLFEIPFIANCIDLWLSSSQYSKIELKSKQYPDAINELISIYTSEGRFWNSSQMFFIEELKKIREAVSLVLDLQEKGSLKLQQDYDLDGDAFRVPFKNRELLNIAIQALELNQRLWYLSGVRIGASSGERAFIIPFIRIFDAFQRIEKKKKLINDAPNIQKSNDELQSLEEHKQQNKNKAKAYYVIIFDELETAFHPQWQKKLMSYILEFFKQFEGVQFQIITTSHSPFMLSDIPKQNVIFLRKGKGGKCEVQNNALTDNKQTFAANIHSLLADDFFLQGALMGDFAKGKINKVIELLSPNNALSEQDKEFCLQVIEMVGEPILKRRLEQLFAQKYQIIDIYQQQQQKIKDLEAEVERLNNLNNKQ